MCTFVIAWIFFYLASSSSKQIGSILTDVRGMAHSSSTYIKTQTPDTVYDVLKALSTEKKNLSRKQLFAFWSFSFTYYYVHTRNAFFFCLEIEYVSSFSFSFFFKLELYIRPFNLHPEKWFEGYPVKSTQIFIGCTLIFLGCCHALIFLGYSLDFFLIYKHETQLFSSCHPEKKPGRRYPKKISDSNVEKSGRCGT